MKRAMIAVAVSILLAAPAFAADTAQQPKASDVSFEQRKAEMLKSIDERITQIQNEKTCIQAATKPDDIKACRDKLRAERKEQRQKIR